MIYGIVFWVPLISEVTTTLVFLGSRLCDTFGFLFGVFTSVREGDRLRRPYMEEGPAGGCTPPAPPMPLGSFVKCIVLYS
jgi:hypothetical protein